MAKSQKLNLIGYSGLFFLWLLVELYFYVRYRVIWSGLYYIPIVAVFGFIVAYRRHRKSQKDSGGQK